VHTSLGVCAVLDVGIRTGGCEKSQVIIRLHRDPDGTDGHYVRLTNLLVTIVPPKLMQNATPMFVDCRNTKSRGVKKLLLERILSPELDLNTGDGNTLLLSFSTAVSIDNTPVAAIGADFHHLDSVIKVHNDWDTHIFGALLRIKTGPGADYLLLVGGRRNPSRRTQWYIEFTVRDSHPGSKASAEPKSLFRFLRAIGERDLFGTWCHSGPLQSVAFWSNPGQGATVCFLELDKIEATQFEVPPDDLRFLILSKSAQKGALDRWIDV
jgi:hypothetical protein